MDLPHVVEYRRELLPEPERETYLAGDAFAEDWIRQIRADVPDAPILVTAGGLFHYFEESKVVGLLRMLTGFGEIEIVFDTVSKSGMAMMRKKYMKQVGHGDAQMFFYVDSAAKLAGKIGGGEDERFIHRQNAAPVAADAALAAKRFRKSLPECDADILYGVVIVHLRIALTGNGKVKAAVCGKKRQHVVQKPAAGIDLGFSRAFKRKRKADVRFCCCAVYRCGAHAVSPFRMSSMAAKSTSICSGVPMVMRTYSEMRGFLKCRTSTPRNFRAL